MKKHYLTIAVMALALGMTACSSKTNETTAPTTTQAQTTEAATASAEAEDDLEEDYFYGFVGEVNGTNRVRARPSSFATGISPVFLGYVLSSCFGKYI